METLIVFFQLIGLALLSTVIIMGGIVFGVWVGKTISQEVF